MIQVMFPSRVWFESRLDSFELCSVWYSNIFWFSLHSAVPILWWWCSPWSNQSSSELCLCFSFCIQSMPQWVWVDRCRCWSSDLTTILWTLPSSTLLSSYCTVTTRMVVYPSYAIVVRLWSGSHSRKFFLILVSASTTILWTS